METEQEDPISSEVKRSIKILLVEDDCVNQQVAQKLLENLGYGVDIASNGQEAIIALSSTRYDLVLMDQQMPVLDGISTTALIRSQKSTVLDSQVCIIAMTAETVAGDKERFLSAGMNDFIAKPIRSKNLQRVISRQLISLLNARQNPNP
jgi:two-component system sensor histidine kinase/response regulator